MRKLFSLFVALLATIPLWAYDFQSGDLYYNITSDTTVEVTYQRYWSCDNYENLKDIVIPENVTYNNVTYLVTSIGDNAFSHPCTPSSSQITSVIIPNNITIIRKYAFYGCNFTSIVIPNGVKLIEHNAFSECSSLTSIIVEDGNTQYDSRDNCNAIIETATNTLIAGCQNTIIPNSVPIIGWAAFCGSPITSFSIPNSVKSIEPYAFYFCESLTSIIIPNSVTNIGDGAFDACSSLTSITIPNSVTSIGSRVFDRCPSLASIKVEEGNTIYDSRDNCNAIIETATNRLIVGCKNTIILNSVTTIGDCAFSSCESLTSVIIPQSVTKIEDYAFAWCYSLKSIIIPNGVASIGNYAFWYCSIDSIIIPNSVTSIGGHVFGHTSLSYITIPNSVTNIGENAFDGCTFTRNNFINNSSLNAEENKYWGATIYEENGLCIVDSVVVDCLESVTSVIIPDTIIAIGDDAFDGCSSLTSITIPNGVTSIGDDAFDGCSSLTSIIIPNGVTTIGEFAFGECSSLKSITIPKSVTNIGIVAFAFCSSLTNMTVEVGNTIYDSRNNCNAIIETATNTLVVGCQNTVIPNSITNIGEYAFLYCDSLKSISIPHSVTALGGEAFAGCHSLTSLTIPNSVTTIGYGAFFDCSSIVSVALPNSITSIDEGLFGLCSSLTSITIPNSVTSIESYAFEDCYSLSSVIIGNSVTNIKRKAFIDCSSLDTITCLATTPPALGESVFDGCENPTLFVPCEALEAYQAHEQWGQFANIQCIASEEVETDDVIITPSTTSVTITWPTAENAYKYIIQISKGSEIVCTLTFNMFGQLLNIQFVPSRTGAHHAQYATQTANGYCFNFTGLEENSTYTYNITTTDEADNTISTYSGEFTTQRNTPTDVENTEAQYPTSDIQKIMHNGQLLILRDGKTYTIMGAEIQ